MPIVTNPTAGDVHVNTPLTNFSQKYLQDSDMFVAMRAMPNLPVMKQSDLYYEFSRADFFRDQAEERADGAETAGGGFKLSTNPYFARVWGFHKDVTDRQRANQDSPVQLDNSATQFVTLKMMIRREVLFQQTFFAPGIWTGSTTGTDIAADWSGVNDPVPAIRAEITSVHQKTGLRPNRMLCGRTAFDTLLDNDGILARIEGGATTEMPAKVLRSLLAQLFEVEEVLVMDGVVNTGGETSAADINDNEANAFIGGDHVLVYYAPRTVGLEEPTAGLTFSWTGLMGATPSGHRIKRFRHEPTASDRVEAEMAFDHRVISSLLGALFIDVSA